jgi:hypothetical protein
MLVCLDRIWLLSAKGSHPLDATARAAERRMIVGKPRMIGMNKPYVPNNRVVQKKNKFKKGKAKCGK